VSKIQYFVLNFLANSRTRKHHPNLLIKKFSPSAESISKNLSLLVEPQSPSRILSNIFWENIKWDYVNTVLRGEIRAIEIGCGSGRYGRKISKLTNIENYTGVDITYSSEWDLVNTQDFKFTIGSYEDFDTLVNNQNLIITQSALEHFEYDLKFFRLIGNYAKNVPFPVLSIHLLPSPVGLLKFLLHGIRQYNRKSLSRLVSVSQPTGDGQLYVLGGFRSNLFHLREITLRSLIFRKWVTEVNVEEYIARIFKPLARDSRSKSMGSPSFYALVLYWDKDTWTEEIV